MGVLMPRSPVRTFSALIQAGRSSGSRRVVGAVTARRLILYYAVVVALVSLVELSLPVGPSGKARILAPWLEQMVLGAVTGTRSVPAWLDAMLSMAAAFVLTVPTVIVYVRTRTEETYDDSLVNTVLVLPSVVTAILIVVESSLARAFSLTGIVAAVRFRNNLKDSRDALYIFAGIAIGFASGVYALDVAVAISLLFVLLELFAWRSGLGGDRAHAQAFLWDESPADPALRAAPRERRPPPATLGNGSSKPPRDIVLRLETTDVDDGMRVVDHVLGVAAKKWRLRRSTPNASKAIVLEYECRLRRAYTPHGVRTRLLHHGEPFVRSAEWDK
jgi:small basic protein